MDLIVELCAIRVNFWDHEVFSVPALDVSLVFLVEELALLDDTVVRAEVGDQIQDQHVFHSVVVLCEVHVES